MSTTVNLADATVLIVEDGNEYLENLGAYVQGPTYVQAHDGAAALAVLRSRPVHLVYLDMRFDRIPKEALLGDHAEATRENNGDAARAWRYLQNNQGLFIQEAMLAAGLGHIPSILSYDFSREVKRVAHLQKRYPKLAWVPDGVTPQQIRLQMEASLR